MRVAVLDSGIFHSKFISDKNIEKEYVVNNGVISEEDAIDFDGHGTACAFEILRQSPETKLVIVKVIHDGKGKLMDIKAALEYLLKSNVDMINLSFAYSSPDGNDTLHSTYIELEKSNKIIVASLQNDATISFPASHKEIIGVKGIEFGNKNEIWFSRHKQIQCLCDNNTFICPGINRVYSLYPKSNSISTARVTGILAHQMQKYNVKVNFESANRVLEQVAVCHIWDDKINLLKIGNHPIWYREKKSIYFDEIKNIVKRYTNIDVSYWKNINYRVLGEHTGIGYDDCIDILNDLENHFGLLIDYFDVSRYIFASLYSLDSYIEEIGK